ncbi:MAG: lipopolysaccharide heptosyltransferase II [Rhodospirillaceae bacterium]|nr:lipopolysaccharide heptosyltransferase II [Rhodospirillaceae bacterium]
MSDAKRGSDAAGRPRILVVAPAWVGDMVMAHSLIQVLRADRPAARITLLAPPATLPLAAFMAEVDAGMVQPVGRGRLGLAERWRLGRSLRAARHDWAILLPNSLKSALAPWWAGIQRRTGYRREGRSVLLTDPRRLDKQRLPRTVDRFVALGRPANAAPGAVPWPRLTVPPGAAEDALASLALAAPAEPLLVLCPGAEYGPAKRWPPASFAAVAAHHRRVTGGDVWVLGGPGDRETADAVAHAVPGALSLAGRTSLAQAVALMSLAHAVVTNDSGLMHVAAALDRPLVGVFGSSSPEMTPPLSQRARVVSLGLACSPCFERVCPLGHTDCLNRLDPQRVIAALPGR